MADGSPLALLGMSAERRSAADALKSRIGLCLVQQLVQQTKMAAREPPSSLCNHLGIGYLMWYSRQESNLRLLPPEGSALSTELREQKYNPIITAERLKRSLYARARLVARPVLVLRQWYAHCSSLRPPSRKRCNCCQKLSRASA